MIYKDKNIYRDALARLLDMSTRCKDCKYCTIFHSIHRINHTTSHSYRYRKVGEMQEDVHYYCEIKKRDVFKFAQCKRFDFRY